MLCNGGGFISFAHIVFSLMGSIFLSVDLLKHTPEEHLDHNTLMKAVEVVKSTLV